MLDIVQEDGPALLHWFSHRNRSLYAKSRFQQKRLLQKYEEVFPDELCRVISCKPDRC